MGHCQPETSSHESGWMTSGDMDRGEVQALSPGSSKVDLGGTDIQIGENPQWGVLEVNTGFHRGGRHQLSEAAKRPSR